jgi:hypothetical protein
MPKHNPPCTRVPIVGIMLYVEMQEGKERTARLKYVQDFQATTACTLRMLAALSLGENSLPPDKKLHRVVFGDSWFASMETMKGVTREIRAAFCGDYQDSTQRISP